MSALRFTVESPAAPATIIDALTDFSDRRPQRWPDLDPAAYRVEEVGTRTALVREGNRSPKLWALEEYDWSEPDVVRWTVRESNFCTPGSSMSARVSPSPTGGSTVDFTWDRTGVGLKGKAIVGMIRLTRAAPLKQSLTKALAGLATGDADNAP